ncbi:hypothetical protein COY90_03955 [Candidatus Roizmanbacteria bacterium CG_4_10_14_0_8_um_filter_39_9]|uniref:Uncharacterized protein n=1 Tax=Candidatus Roizmanbacteria bacterium CG_4_10_14_0_8_um_filter_39_9 TaxID=1974829 RepID=A0A2M7QC42_9BACT|nr:MAG: hypothetical protein COY90_03955 [Candidatus Roizmanbacteria bacterium CG_4_10_14_0_8_um_filter_39_9]
MTIMQTLDKKPLFSKSKLVFIILLLLSGLGFYVYATSHPAKPAGSILGEEINALPTQAPIDFNGIKKTANTYLDNAVRTSQTAVQSAVKQGSEVVADVASQAVDNVKDRIVDSTVRSVVKQIEKLPKEEQEKIREYICK